MLLAYIGLFFLSIKLYTIQLAVEYNLEKAASDSRKTLLQPQGLDLPTRWANNSKSGNSMHNFDRR